MIYITPITCLDYNQLHNFKFSGPTPLRSEMSKIMEVFTRTAIPRDRLEGSPYPENAAMFISSIARTNLGMVSNKM